MMEDDGLNRNKINDLDHESCGLVLYYHLINLAIFFILRNKNIHFILFLIVQYQIVLFIHLRINYLLLRR